MHSCGGRCRRCDQYFCINCNTNHVCRRVGPYGLSEGSMVESLNIEEMMNDDKNDKMSNDDWNVKNDNGYYRMTK